MKNNGIQKVIARFFDEDDLGRNQFYMQDLPNEVVECSLKIKSNLILAGIPYFNEAFRYLGAETGLDVWELDGKKFRKGDVINFKLPFGIALTGERIALNLLQKASSIATYTNEFVEKAQNYEIAILDTRKTTPGLRALEKYAVRLGGGYNHRLGQSDVWMVKDNHKNFFGGISNAVSFFTGMQGFYTPIVVEVHNENEFEECLDLGIKHIMLDNFSRDEILKLIERKSNQMTIEISGGVTLENIDDYLIDGVDAISIGSLTYAAPAVDLSLKYQKI